MGIDLVQLEQLIDLATRWDRTGRALMLGRQGLHIRAGQERVANRLLRRKGFDFTIAEARQADGFTETLLRRLGFGEVESLDFSTYEGASIVHDLNRPVADTLHESFDLIFDGGTIEHVFATSVALDNVFAMLREGGVFVSCNGMNGWVGHGLYQFNPELVWTYWQRGKGCTVRRCLGLSKDETRDPIIFPDPAVRGKRLRLRDVVPKGRLYLYYEVEKVPGAIADGAVLQSDYLAKWTRQAHIEGMST